MPKYDYEIRQIVWIKGMKDESNTVAKVLKTQGAKGWRLVQVRDERRWDIYLTKVQVDKGAFVKRYERLSNWGTTGAKWSERKKHYGAYCSQEMDFPIGVKVEFWYYLEKEL